MSSPWAHALVAEEWKPLIVGAPKPSLSSCSSRLLQAQKQTSHACNHKTIQRIAIDKRAVTLLLEVYSLFLLQQRSSHWTSTPALCSCVQRMKGRLHLKKREALIRCSCRFFDARLLASSVLGVAEVALQCGRSTKHV